MPEHHTQPCPKCGQPIEVPAGPGDHAVQCASCGQVFRVVHRPAEPAAPGMQAAPYGPAGPPHTLPPAAPWQPIPPRPPPQGPAVTPMMCDHLRATRPWVIFMAVMAFIACGLMIIGAIVILVASGQRRHPGPAPVMAVGFLIGAILGFFPASFLMSYASGIGRFLTSGNNLDLEAALGSQKSYWKFVGILTIIALGLEVIGLIATFGMMGMR